MIECEHCGNHHSSYTDPHGHEHHCTTSTDTSIPVSGSTSGTMSRIKWLLWEKVLAELQQQHSFLSRNDFEVFIQQKCPISRYRPSFCNTAQGQQMGKTTRRNICLLMNVIYIYYCKLLDPKGPLVVKCTNNCGLGLFVQRSKLYKLNRSRYLLQDYLFGVLLEVKCKKEVQLLRQANYSSLYKNGESTYILCGPLSLVNHACNALFAFSFPNSMKTKNYPTEFSKLYCVYTKHMGMKWKVKTFVARNRMAKEVDLLQHDQEVPNAFLAELSQQVEIGSYDVDYSKNDEPGPLFQAALYKAINQEDPSPNTMELFDVENSEEKLILLMILAHPKKAKQVEEEEEEEKEDVEEDEAEELDEEEDANKEADQKKEENEDDDQDQTKQSQEKHHRRRTSQHNDDDSSPLSQNSRADPSTVIIMGDGLLNLNLHLAAFDPSSVNLDLDHIHIFTICPKVISSNRGKN
ncbi:Translation initiation factor IF-2 [Balamuthia mandrillaris]